MARDPKDRKLLRTKARQAALADTAREHPETYRKHYMRRVSEVFSAVGLEARHNKRLPTHVDGGDGKCVHCGNPTPCRAMRRRSNNGG